MRTRTRTARRKTRRPKDSEAVPDPVIHQSGTAFQRFFVKLLLIIEQSGGSLAGNLLPNRTSREKTRRFVISRSAPMRSRRDPRGDHDRAAMETFATRA